MNEKMYEELKSAVFDHGVEAIDDLLGYEHNHNENAAAVRDRMDDILDQMPEDIALEFYYKYCN